MKTIKVYYDGKEILIFRCVADRLGIKDGQYLTKSLFNCYNSKKNEISRLA